MKKTAIAALVLLVGGLAFVRVTSDNHDINNYWQGAPNATWRAREVTIAVDGPDPMFDNARFKAQIAKIDRQLPITRENDITVGRHIVW
jgi:hypothetical protein